MVTRPTHHEWDVDSAYGVILSHTRVTLHRIKLEDLFLCVSNLVSIIQLTHKLLGSVLPADTSQVSFFRLPHLLINSVTGPGFLTTQAYKSS